MMDIHKNIVDLLSPILPVYYELAANNNVKLPCITYVLNDLNDAEIGTTLQYQNVSVTIKVWGLGIEVINNKSEEVYRVLQNGGYRRTYTGEIINDGVIQKIMTFNGKTYTYKPEGWR